MARSKPKEQEIPVVSLVEDAASEISDLMSEMGDWRDNMSNANMEHLPKYEEVEAAAETLENIDSEINDHVEEYAKLMEGTPETETVKMTLMAGRLSRSSRASNAGAMLEVASEIVAKKAEAEKDGDRKADLESLASSLEDQANELYGVDFPGMY